MSHFFITGGTGFIGRRLVETLAGDHANKITVLTRQENPDIKRFSGVSISHVNLLDAERLISALSGHQVVIHLAYGNSGTAADRYSTTVVGTQNLLNASIKAGIAKFIHISTISVYGEPPFSQIYTERSPNLASTKEYASSKQQAELAAIKASKEGLNVIILQPGIVYGPGTGYWTSGLLKILKNFSFPIIDEGTGFCNSIYVDDVVDGIICAVKADIDSGERFILTDDEPATWKVFLGCYEEMINRKCLIEFNSDKLNEMVDLPSSLYKLSRLYPLLYGMKPLVSLDDQQIQFFTAKPIFSNLKARESMKFIPSYDLKSGMKIIKDWYCEGSV